MIFNFLKISSLDLESSKSLKMNVLKIWNQFECKMKVYWFLKNEICIWKLLQSCHLSFNFVFVERSAVWNGCLCGPSKYIILNNSVIEILISDGRRLPLNRRQHIFPNGTLLLENVQGDPDRGIYRCTASNKQGRSATQTLPLNVIGRAGRLNPVLLIRSVA